MSTSRERKRNTAAEKASSIEYVSPFKRVKQAMIESDDKRVVQTVDELKDFIRQNDVSDLSVVAGIALQLRLVWTSYDTCKTGPVARMHLIDKQADEELNEMQEVLRDHYAIRKRIVDKELITASLYGLTEGAEGIPVDGSIITIRNIWGLKLFAERSCQLTTSVDSIKLDAAP